MFSRHHYFALCMAVVVGTVFVAVTASALIIHPVFFAAASVTALDRVADPEITRDAEEDAYDSMAGTNLAIPPVVVSPTPVVSLHRPPIESLLRMAGEPNLAPGEKGIRVPVLMYHHIRPMTGLNAKEKKYSVSPEAFSAQMKELKRAGYQTITPDELSRALREGAAILPSKPVLLTFDDGYRNQYEHAFPVLRDLHLRATFFIVSQAHVNKGSVTQAMVKEMDESGLVTIGAHTEHHAYLTKYGKAKRIEEIAGSKKRLEALLGHPVTAFAYPYGAWSREIQDEVRSAGFETGFWVRMGSLHVESSRYLLRRIRVEEGESVADILDAFSL